MGRPQPAPEPQVVRSGPTTRKVQPPDKLLHRPKHVRLEEQRRIDAMLDRLDREVEIATGRIRE